LVKNFVGAKVNKLTYNSKYWYQFKTKKEKVAMDLLLEIVENTDKISLCNIF